MNIPSAARIALLALCPLAFLLGFSPCAGAEPLHLVERSDWSRYVNGAYAGHSWRESRTILDAPASGTPQAGRDPGPSTLSGEWFVLEESSRDTRAEARRVDRSGSSTIGLGIFGSFGEDATAPVPSIRGLLDLSRASERRGMPGPAATAAKVGSAGSGSGESPGLAELLPLGSAFIAPGLRLVDLRGSIQALPFLAEYRVVSLTSYANQPALQVKAKFATRLAYPQGGLERASGSHDLDIWLELDSGRPLFVRDLFDETFSFAGGGTERRAGSTLVFWKGGDSTGRGTLVASLGQALGGGEPAAAPGQASLSGTPGAGSTPQGWAGPDLTGGAADPAGGGILLSAASGPLQGGDEPLGAPQDPDFAAVLAADPGLAASLEKDGLGLSQGDAGVVLSIFDLRFKADSDELLSSERPRLDLVARALSAAPPGRDFLVEGHAASAGKPQGELDLSLKRAKRIVDELVARGLAPVRFVYRGLGSSKPVAPNDSEAGKAKNRRVEITILD